MTIRRRTHVHALDPVTAAGLTAQLRGHPAIELVEPGASADADSVAICAVDSTLTEGAVTMVRKAKRHGCRRVVLVSSAPSNLDLMAAIDLGVCAILPRNEASTHRLAQAILSVAAGEAAMPADLLARLLDHVARIQSDVLVPRGLHVSGMADRERRILSLVADGMDTREIASELNYSERTVKNVLHDVTTRFQLRNRSQAVAYALREGLI
jgi:DNA-binding NarL/FixJ family response regulator